MPGLVWSPAGLAPVGLQRVVVVGIARDGHVRLVPCTSSHIDHTSLPYGIAPEKLGILPNIHEPIPRGLSEGVDIPRTRGYEYSECAILNVVRLCEVDGDDLVRTLTGELVSVACWGLYDMIGKQDKVYIDQLLSQLSAAHDSEATVSAVDSVNPGEEVQVARGGAEAAVSKGGNEEQKAATNVIDEYAISQAYEVDEEVLADVVR